MSALFELHKENIPPSSTNVQNIAVTHPVREEVKILTTSFNDNKINNDMENEVCVVVDDKVKSFNSVIEKMESLIEKVSFKSLFYYS
jgi:phosphoribosylpyrophosphate synthetase